MRAWRQRDDEDDTRPVIARALSRSGHVLLPVVLIGLGVLILVEGGAFGL